MTDRPHNTFAFQRNRELPFREMDGGGVVVQPATREIHMLSAVGARIWQLLETEQTLDDIALTLEKEYQADGQQIRLETGRFIAEMVAKQLVIEQPIARDLDSTAESHR